MLMFLAVVDLAVSRGDDQLLRRSADDTAAELAKSGVGDGEAADGCDTVGMRDRPSPARDAVCLVKAGVGRVGQETRVRVAWDGDEVVVCAMMRPRSVTGLLGPLQERRTLRTVAVRPASDDVDSVGAASERALAGTDWEFCPADRAATEAP
jgi:hypothetical protein